MKSFERAVSVQAANACLLCLMVPLCALTLGLSSYSIHTRQFAGNTLALVSYVLGTAGAVFSFVVILVGILAAWVGDPAFRRAWVWGLLVVGAVIGASASLATVVNYRKPGSGFIVQMGVAWACFGAILLSLLLELGTSLATGRGAAYEAGTADYHAMAAREDEFAKGFRAMSPPPEAATMHSSSPTVRQSDSFGNPSPAQNRWSSIPAARRPRTRTITGLKMAANSPVPPTHERLIADDPLGVANSRNPAMIFPAIPMPEPAAFPLQAPPIFLPGSSSLGDPSGLLGGLPLVSKPALTHARGTWHDQQFASLPSTEILPSALQPKTDELDHFVTPIPEPEASRTSFAGGEDSGQERGVFHLPILTKEQIADNVGNFPNPDSAMMWTTEGSVASDAGSITGSQGGVAWDEV